jgi:Flp pilus assembly pilin Flp
MSRLLKKLHKDEAGLKTLETVAILAIACIILAVIKYFWNDIKEWFDKKASVVTKDDWAEAKTGN